MIETLAIGRLSIRDIFIEKLCIKCAPKLVPDPNSHCLQKIIFKKDISKEDYQKALKKLTLFFLSSPVHFHG